MEEGLARAFRGPCEQRSAHDGRCAQGERHGDVAARLHTPIGNDGHPVLVVRKARHVVDGAALGPADRACLARREERAAAHAHAEAIGARLEQGFCLTGRHNVAADDIEAGKLMLYILEEFDLWKGVALGGVQDERVHPGFHELPHPLVLGGLWPAGRGHQKLLVWISGGVRVAPALLQVAAADDRHELAGLVQDRKLALLARPQPLVGFRQGDWLLADHHLQPRRHDLSKFGLPVLDKIDVPARYDAHELVAHSAVLGDQDG
mmetsp:Transcript_97194/g.258292  ORF Transcript_97194/g.258292 Transcript_97194/m.258292 type:complete len:263 (+) Transcript_97194:375-1163(+)